MNTAVTTSVVVSTTVDSIRTESCTPAQSAEVFFPEFNYKREQKKFEPLVLDKTTNVFEFKEMTYSEHTGKKHYIPVWYPNGDYITQTLVSDMWTPLGKLNYLGKSNIVTVDGSLFDDYNSSERSQ